MPEAYSLSLYLDEMIKLLWQSDIEYIVDALTKLTMRNECLV